MATVTDSNTASAASVTINRRKTPDKDCSACCATTLDIPCNSGGEFPGEFPLALPLSEVKARFPLPLQLMHFHSGPLMYFRSGVDNRGRVICILRPKATAADIDSPCWL